MAVIAADIRAALHARYAPPTWTAATEVPDATGAQRRRTDFLAVNCYASQGYEIHGVEIKVSRSDWQRELRQPDKTDEGAYRYCDRWWIAAPPGVVKDGELPPTWGLLELRGAALKASVKAPKLTPQPPDVPFLAALMRAVNRPGEQELNALVNQRTQDLQARLSSIQEDEQRRYAEYAARVTAETTAFGELIGVHWTHLDPQERQEIAAVIQAARTLGQAGRRGALLQARRAVQDATQILERAAQILDLRGPEQP